MAEQAPENTSEPATDPPVTLAADQAESAASSTPDAVEDVHSGSPVDVNAMPPIAEQAPAQGVSTDIDLSRLPSHTRSLLKIPVTVRATLAHQRRPLSEIRELGPGTLIKFEKTYDKPLQLSIGDLPIAEGEAVKVGDKFGLRIGAIIRPHERFRSVG